LPFGYGPRTCPGKNFGTQKIKLALTKVKYRVIFVTIFGGGGGGGEYFLLFVF